MDFQKENSQILSWLPLSQEEAQSLFDNGFDDDEAIKLIDIQTLQKLGIQSPQKIYDIIHSSYSSQQETPKSSQSQSIKISKAEAKPKSITTRLILSSIQNQQKSTKSQCTSQQEQQIQKMTHLQLNNKKIEKIDQLNFCTNLKVVYLYDNQISIIEGLQNLKNLIQLSLYNNRINKIQGLEGLVSLRRLYLEKNYISRLEGLTCCTQLEELNLSNQQSKDQEFTFDEYSLAAISSSLRSLDISNSNVISPKPLYFLENLEKLNLKRNYIQDFDLQVSPMLQTMNQLKQLNMSENPVSGIKKYRDQIVLLSNSLDELDNKKIKEQERQYLHQLVKRRQIKMQPEIEQKKKQKNDAFEICGKNKQLHNPHDQISEQVSEESETQNQFYQLEENEPKYENKIKPNPYQKKKSININSNYDFTSIGSSHQSTKHVPNIAKRF